MKRIISSIAAFVMALSVFITPSYAENLSGGIYGISDANFTLPSKTEIIFGSNTAEVVKNVMKIPGEFEKNSELWHAVEEIKITFYIDRVNTPLSADFSGLFVQGVMQLGEGAGNAWADSDNNTGYVSIAPQSSGEFDLTQEYTLIFRPRAFMDLHNAGTASNKNGGATLLGLKVGNMGKSTLSLGIRFTDMAIYGEPDVIARFRANAKTTAPAVTGALTGTPPLQAAQSSQPAYTAQATAPAGNTASETTTSVQPETSYEPPVTTPEYSHTDYVSVPFSLNAETATAPPETLPQTAAQTFSQTAAKTAKKVPVTAEKAKSASAARYASQASKSENREESAAREDFPDTGISTTETLIALGVFILLAIAAATLAFITRKK